MYPFAIAAGALALYFIATALRKAHPARILAAILWAAYAVYEYHVANGTLCDANCNIRVDLVLFLPLLASAAYLAFQDAPRTGPVTVLSVICLGLIAVLAPAFGYKSLAVIAGGGAVIAGFLGVRSMFAAKRG